ncbi:discoidin domain-containing protein [Ensifer adhaerens]|uniref:discoidin domain-containing protein n=1 Tax=Ensifer adhaerens TaxID=106592 RepID=UPI001319D8F7|nr:discoidin domain-containing protein [Ensifer adhaerens]
MYIPPLELVGSEPVLTPRESEHFATVSTRLRPVSGCRVIASSGCHRYGYWNEQYLFDGRADTGWCTPSRTRSQSEFLEISTGCQTPIQRIRMLSRAINPEAGFPKRMQVRSAKAEGEWQAPVTLQSSQLTSTCWHEWSLPGLHAPYLRLDFFDVARRQEGKYFLQFMALELLTEVIDVD